jgi:hypothetical protein
MAALAEGDLGRRPGLLAAADEIANPRPASGSPPAARRHAARRHSGSNPRQVLSGEG